MKKWLQDSEMNMKAIFGEHCTGIAEVMGSNPVQAWIFFRPYFHYRLSSVQYWKDGFHIHFSIRRSHTSFSYIHSHLKVFQTYTDWLHNQINSRWRFIFSSCLFFSLRLFSNWKIHCVKPSYLKHLKK